MKYLALCLFATTSIFGQMETETTQDTEQTEKKEAIAQPQKSEAHECAPCNPCQPPAVCKPVPQPRCGTLQEPQPPIVCAYNAPAEIYIGMDEDCDFFGIASFIYWQPLQDHMAIGLTDNLTLLGVGPEANSIQGSFIEMDFDFKPGFQIGLGMNLAWDDWDGFLEYTRVHGSHFARSNGPLSSPSIFATWGHPFLMNGAIDSLGGVTGIGGQVFNTAKGHYRNHLDFLDIDLGRKYYVGKKLVFRSAFGARAAWILQSMHAKYVNNATTFRFDPSGDIFSLPSTLEVYQRSHSWAIGPRAGLTMDWNICWDFRFIGSVYGDILYTKYKIQDKSVLTPFTTEFHTAAGIPVFVITKDILRVLRSHLDFEMGIGWGAYVGTNDWHLDVIATYGFQVFFDQNMFHHFTSPTFVGSYELPEGNLYVQGLTLMARIDF